MKLSSFDFKLPTDLIATEPSTYRDESRLFVVDTKTGKFEHRIFKDIIDYFDENDVIVFNDSKVFPARLYGNKEKTGAKIEVFLLRELNREHLLWDVLVDPARKIRIGNKLYFGDNDELVAEVIDNTTSRGRTLRFLFDGDHDEFKKILFSLGETPLPDTIKRVPTPEDEERFQTIYATNEGSVVAPAAGFHFSRELLKRLEIKGVNRANITLHAGLGNYRHIEVEDLSKHKVDSEDMFISQEAADIINAGKDAKANIVAVGSTVIRAVETSVTTECRVKPYEGWTNKFIFPPYDFRVANRYISNFHMPKSSFLMINCAFGGYDAIMDVYNEAVKQKYRFGEYGDAMFII